MSKALLAFTIACFVVVTGCTTPGIHHALRINGQAPSASPQVLAVYMPWFGDHSHIDVGYSSQDPAVLRRQIQDARHMGIAGFVVDWYGPSNPYSDHNFGLLQEAASENHFHVALLYNEPEDEDAQATDGAMAAMDRAYDFYIGPNAKYRDAYLTFNGRPLIFVFPKRGHVDWNRVNQHISGWGAAPMMIYKDQPPAQYAADFAGSYAWVQPGGTGWSKDGRNWGEQYLESFYRTMRNDHPDKIAVGGAWPGFDDSRAKWGLNRHMQARCGKTFDETLNLYRHVYDESNPLPFMLIETWNDYEEGTAIEHRTLTDCGNPGGSSTKTGE
ncbi:MAG TPA: hypothetical protein VI386_29385 [Candidatus Sulfotelmatobacter sp.]